MPDNKDTILLIDGAHFFTNMLSKRIQEQTRFRILTAERLDEAAAIIEREQARIFLGLTGMVLPDANDGDSVALLTGCDIPCIVFTGNVSDELRKEMMALPIVDYVPKDNDASIDYITNLINHLDRNRTSSALVVDDSSTARKRFGTILSHLMFRVLEADSSANALRLLEQHRGKVSIVLVDYSMAGGDGVELVRAIRHFASPDEMAIVGISGTGDPALAASFLKGGASDYVAKTALSEEIVVRILTNLDRLHYIRELKKAAAHDFLTGLFNRRYFYKAGGALHANARRKKMPIAVAMLDIDHFKQVNDRYGHDTGDMVLKAVAHRIAARLRGSDLVARFGGEEFCAIAMGAEAAAARKLFEGICREIAEQPIATHNHEIPVTISIGVQISDTESLDTMVSRADEMLYQAKEQGRNRVCCNA